ncbi:hypothetical protein [Streptomyces salinarius]|uniref:hypothetical protein n=1 Tax=Streptomyces salinarius TaxID=2762598 RepID=UPI0016486F13|nr:hypothetical protein [Streptomyces salinarius]
MPKKQPTAAKRARAAARAGAKYTAALREAGGPQLPPHLDLIDADALPEDERMVVDCLRALAAAGEPLTLRVADPDPEVLEARMRAEEKGITPQWHRWASVQAAVDGYVLRETQYGPNRSGYSSRNRGPRVPVPVRAADGTVTVVAMPEWARLHEGRWIWEHTGWPLDSISGQIVDPPQEFSPAPGLRWQVAVWLDLAHEGKVLGEDYVGGTSNWSTVGWCTNRDDAQLIARAFTAHRGNHARADVIEHGTDNGVVSMTTDTYLTTPDAPAHPRPPALGEQRGTLAAGPRPTSPDRSEIPEPGWYQGVKHPPNSSLIVWTGSGWRTLVHTYWQSANIAAVLGIGAGGPYAWAESWGPRHPDRDMHDWIQEGRELTHRFPEPTYPERRELIDAARRAREDALVAALAERGGMTREQAAARIAEGGEKYRQVLDVGQAIISRALHTARRALPEGPERTAIRQALDDLMGRHVLPADAERIAGKQLDSEIESVRSPGTTAWCRRAVSEYVLPAADPAAAGIEGFRRQDTVVS